MSEHMSDKNVKRYVRNMSDKTVKTYVRRIVRQECQKICQKECQKECQKLCQKRMSEDMSEKNVRNNVRIGCQKRWQKICQKRMSEDMSEEISQRTSPHHTASHVPFSPLRSRYDEDEGVRDAPTVGTWRLSSVTFSYFHSVNPMYNERSGWKASRDCGWCVKVKGSIRHESLLAIDTRHTIHREWPLRVSLTDLFWHPLLLVLARF